MASVEKKQGQKSSSESLVSVQTADLKERLNRLYCHLREASSGSRELGHFDSLWDLKELALLQRRQSVDVPAHWLAETEELDERRPLRHGH